MKISTKSLATAPHLAGLTKTKKPKFVTVNVSTFYFFTHIVACEAATNCSGHGACRADGTCECDSQFFAADCTSKL